MAKHQGATPRRAPNSVSFFAAMLVGALLTLGIVLFIYLWNPFNHGKVEPANEETTMVKPKAAQTSGEPPNYEFYDLLRQQQVSGIPNDASTTQSSTIPVTQPDVIVTAPSATTRSQTTGNQADSVNNPMLDSPDSGTASSEDSNNPLISGQSSTSTDHNPDTPTTRTFILQINSFDNSDDADRRRAEVLMAGVDAQIVKRRLKNDKVIYQVVSREMTSSQSVADAQRRLQSSGIDSLIVEQRHSN